MLFSNFTLFQSDGYKMVSNFSNFQFLISSEAKHCFICLLVIQFSSFVNCLSTSFIIFKLVAILFLWICRSYLSILIVNFCVLCANVFSQALAFLLMCTNFYYGDIYILMVSKLLNISLRVYFFPILTL